MSVIHFMRHGATTLPNTFCGATDVALTPDGRRHMHEALSDSGQWDEIVSSPLRRCADFAREFATRRDIPLVIDPRWREMDFGTWEGLRADQIGEAELTAFWSDPAHEPPPHRGEALAHFEGRLCDAWRALTHRAESRRVLVVTHGGVIRVLQQRAQRLPRSDLLTIIVAHHSVHAIPTDAAICTSA